MNPYDPPNGIDNDGNGYKDKGVTQSRGKVPT